MLVHPRLVAYAAHCGEFSAVSVLRPGLGWRDIPTSGCKSRAGSSLGAGNDIAFCRLKSDILDVPIVPFATGCELANVFSGVDVTIVGFGKTKNDDGFGQQRFGVTKIVHLGTELEIGSPQVAPCKGDSGGPAFVKLDVGVDGRFDGSFRLIGILSSAIGDGCDGRTGYYTPAEIAVPWLERESGLDLTPCSNIDGSWSPSPRCTRILRDADGISGCPSGLSYVESPQTCGAPFSRPSEETTFETEIASPIDGTKFLLPSGEVDVEVPVVVNVSAEHVTPIQEVRVRVMDGEGLVAEDVLEIPPYSFLGSRFPAGTWRFVSTVRDYAGLVSTDSSTIKVVRGAAETHTNSGGCSMSGHHDPGHRASALTLILLLLALRTSSTREGSAGKCSGGRFEST